jgi:peptidoglycan glycosyltransferase
MNQMNRPLKRISLAILVMFLILLVNVNYLQAVEAPSLASRPENIRASAQQNNVQRGNIVTQDGVVVATTKPTNDFYKFLRVYSNGPVYAPVTGYDTLFSSTGVEHAESQLLSGTGDQLAFRNFLDKLSNKPQKGATVQLTINSKAQIAAYQALQSTLQNKTFNGHQAIGGVVALNPSTGAILAMASFPSYDPNTLATHNVKQLNIVDHQLLTQNPTPLLNNATQSTLPPGSTFKIVTSSAWYTQDPARNPSLLIDSPQPLKLPNGNFLNNDSGEKCGNGTGHTQVLVAFAQSCNTPFAKLGYLMGGQTIKDMASRYGLNNAALAIPGVTVAESNFTAEEDPSFTAFDAIGQHDTTVTPLQEAMFAATVANNGTLMKPYLIQQVTASDLAIVAQTQTQVLTQQVISPTVASYLKQMMIAVVQQPYGTAAAFNTNAEGVTIAGKTGTAQNGLSANPDAVFTAFAPADNPKIAVGVMIQGGGYGAQSAAPIAVAVIKAYLASQGIPS